MRHRGDGYAIDGVIEGFAHRQAGIAGLGSGRLRVDQFHPVIYKRELILHGGRVRIGHAKDISSKSEALRRIGPIEEITHKAHPIIAPCAYWNFDGEKTDGIDIIKARYRISVGA